MHMHKGLVGKLAHRILANTGKKCVTKLVEASLHDFRRIIGQHQHDRADQNDRNIIRRMKLAVQRIGHPFEEIGYEDQHNLGQNQIECGPDHAHSQVRPVGRPHVGPQISQCFQRLAGFGRNRLGGIHRFILSDRAFEQVRFSRNEGTACLFGFFACLDPVTAGPEPSLAK
ncbi:hypothetical protein C038_00381 [Brucella sp. 63/311]|nr:hypothetical protein C038_00381 [Brucella sp. 63/311]